VRWLVLTRIVRLLLREKPLSLFRLSGFDPLVDFLRAPTFQFLTTSNNDMAEERNCKVAVTRRHVIRVYAVVFNHFKYMAPLFSHIPSAAPLCENWVKTSVILTFT
jgi:hypothetical protein